MLPGSMSSVNPRRWVPELVSALFAVMASVFVAGDAWGRGFPLDDAWIHMVYGLSLSEGGGFSYNAGSAGSGATSPLWAVVAALAHLVVGGGPSMYAATTFKVLGVASHALSAAMAAHLARMTSPAPSQRLGGVIAGMIVAVCPVLAFAAVSGMEVSLTSALLLGALAAAAKKRPVATAVWTGLALSARPEAIVLLPFVTLLVARGHAPMSSIRRGALAFGGALALPAAWSLRNLVATGMLVPSTIYAKALPKQLSTLHTIRTALFTMLGEIRPMGTVVGWLLVVTAIVLAARKARAVWKGDDEDDGVLVAAAGALVALAWTLGLCVHTDFYTPRWFYFLRYVLPPLPLVLVCAVTVASHLGGVIATRVTPRAGRGFVALAGIAATSWEISGTSEMRAAYAHDVDGIDAVQVAVGRFLQKNLPPSAVVWSPDAGAIRYFGRQRVVDLEKLNTPDLVAHHEVKAGWEPNAVVLIVPYGDRAAFDDGAPHIVFEAPTNWSERPIPKDWPGAMPTQVVVACPAGRAVEVRRGAKLTAHARCAAEASQ